MTEIKSALELALERTQNIQGDKESIKSNEHKNAGKRLASAFLDPVDEVDEKNVISQIKERSGKEQAWFREGFFTVLLANVSLPVTDDFEHKLSLLEKGFNAVLKERRQIAYIFQQVSQFFSQYLQSREQLEEAVKQQYEPRLREKEKMLEQQMGAKVTLAHEQDQEYLTLLSKNYAQLEEQYNQALQQVKDQLKQMFGAG
jgi:hypothetical protein